MQEPERGLGLDHLVVVEARAIEVAQRDAEGERGADQRSDGEPPHRISTRSGRRCRRAGGDRRSAARRRPCRRCGPGGARAARRRPAPRRARPAARARTGTPRSDARAGGRRSSRPPRSRAAHARASANARIGSSTRSDGSAQRSGPAKPQSSATTRARRPGARRTTASDQRPLPPVLRISSSVTRPACAAPRHAARSASAIRPRAAGLPRRRQLARRDRDDEPRQRPGVQKWWMRTARGVSAMPAKVKSAASRAKVCAG